MTGAPEILGGRVKTLHPKIHGGILADLEDPDHVTQLVEHDIGPIDLVCINLYPFEETVAGGASETEAIEQIDIGGPAMLRAAAKNFKSVTVVPSPGFYERGPRGARERRARSPRRPAAAWPSPRSASTAEYDAAISAGSPTAQKTSSPDAANGAATRQVSSLRYGENPHQEAAYYAEQGAEHLLSGVEKLQGREISFNNLYDLDAARTLLADLTDLEARPRR